MLSDFSHNGKVPIMSEFFSDLDTIESDLEWTNELIEDMFEKHRNGKPRGLYPMKDRLNVEWHIKEKLDVKGKHVLVIGTQVQFKLISPNMKSLCYIFCSLFSLSLFSFENLLSLKNKKLTTFFD